MTATAAVIRFGLAAGASAAELEQQLRLERGVGQIDLVAGVHLTAMAPLLKNFCRCRAGAAAKQDPNTSKPKPHR